MKSTQNSSRVLAVLVLISSFGLSSGEILPAERMEQVRKEEARQQQIQGDSQKLASLWAAMFDEYERNGLGGGDADIVKSLRGTVSHLSENEMRAVIELLQKSRSVQDAKAAQQQIAGAYSTQKSVVVELQRLIAEFDHTRVEAEIAAKLKDISQRTSLNLKKTIDLERSSKSAEAALFAPVLKASLEQQQQEQSAIAEDLKAAVSQIESLKHGSQDSDTPWKNLLGKAREASPVLDAAAGALKNEQLPQAIEKARIAKDAMLQLVRMVTPEDRLQVLREAEPKLDRMVQEQQAVLKQTGEIPVERNMDQWIAKAMQDPASPLAKMLAKAPVKPGVAVREDPRVKGAFDQLAKRRGSDATALEKREAEVAENSRDLRSDLENSGKKVSDALKGVEAPLKSAGAALAPQTSGTSPDPAIQAAVKDEAAALAQMQAAQGALQQELAQAETAARLAAASSSEAPSSSQQPSATAPQGSQPGPSSTQAPSLATLQDLQRQAHDLMMQQAQAAAAAKQQAVAEKKAAGTPGVPGDSQNRDEQNLAAVQAQKVMRERTGQLKDRAEVVAPQAAQSLAQAASDMQRAQAALTDPGQRAEAALAAQRSLSAAEKQLGAEISGSKQGNDALEAATKAADALPPIIEAEQKLELDTMKAAGAGMSPAAAKDFGARQAQIQKDLSNYRHTPGIAPDAARALAEADREMNGARSSANKNDAAGVDKAERTAIDKLYKASEAQAAKIADLEKQYGQSLEAKGSDPAQARYQLERAQQQIQQAMDGMKSADDGRAGILPANSERGQDARAPVPESGAPGAPDWRAGILPANSGRRQDARASVPESGASGSGPMQRAAQQLNNAVADVNQAQAVVGESNPAANALQDARSALDAAASQVAQAAQSAGGNSAAAQESAASAERAIAKANAILSEQQAGLSPSGGNQSGQASSSPSSQSSGNQPPQAPGGQGSPSGNGPTSQSQNQQPSQPGGGQSAQASNGQTSPSGDGQSSQSQSQQPSQPGGTASNGSDGHSEQALQHGGREVAKARPQFIGLPPRERAAIEQSQSEKYPEEYGAMVEQYMQNLSDHPHQ